MRPIQTHAGRLPACIPHLNPPTVRRGCQLLTLPDRDDVPLRVNDHNWLVYRTFKRICIRSILQSTSGRNLPRVREGGSPMKDCSSRLTLFLSVCLSFQRGWLYQSRLTSPLTPVCRTPRAASSTSLLLILGYFVIQVLNRTLD